MSDGDEPQRKIIFRDKPFDMLAAGFFFAAGSWLFHKVGQWLTGMSNNRSDDEDDD